MFTNSNFKEIPYRQRDAWFTIFASFLLLLVSGFVANPIHTALPSVSILILDFILPATNLLILIIYLSYRYGCVHFSDFLLREYNLMVLFLGLTILTIMAGTIVIQGPYEPYTLYGQRISQLPRREYIVVLLLLFFIGPIFSEIFFRRYIFEIFREEYDVLIAVLLTSFSDAFLHFGAWVDDITLFISFFFSAIFLNIAYLIGGLGMSTVIHCLINIMIIVIV